MGIVAKQSILNTVYTYTGFLFGAINTLFLFTYIFNKTDYGLITYLMTASNLLWPFLAFGMQNTLIKFYHSYESKRARDNFFSCMLLVPIFTTLLALIIYVIFHQKIVYYFENANTVVAPYVWLIIVLGFFTAYFELFFAWAKVHLKSVQGNFIKAVFLRLITSILIIQVYFKILSIDQFIYCFCFTYLVRTVMMAIIAYQIQPFKIQIKAIDGVKEIVAYSSLILIASVVAVYLLDLDKIMIEYFRPIEELPAYNIAIYIASVIAVPARALLQITSPLVAKFLISKEYPLLNDLNRKSSINGLLVAGMIAVLILTNTHSIFELVPKNYSLFIEIVFYIALVRVFDASLGITNSILINSEAYRWTLVFGILILILAFSLNMLLIPSKGIVGASIATFVSYIVFNVIKLAFVKYYFKIQPYQQKSVIAICLLLSVGLLFYWLKFPQLHPLLSIITKGLISLSVLVFLVYKLKLSNDINTVINRIIRA